MATSNVSKSSFKATFCTVARLLRRYKKVYFCIKYIFYMYLNTFSSNFEVLSFEWDIETPFCKKSKNMGLNFFLISSVFVVFYLSLRPFVGMLSCRNQQKETRMRCPELGSSTRSACSGCRCMTSTACTALLPQTEPEK